MATKVRHDKPGPFDRVLAFLDILLARAALVIEGDDALRRARQVAHDKADARVQLAGMPFDLGHDVARLVPALRQIGEAGVVPSYLVRRSPNGALEQVSDPLLQHPVGRQSDRVADALGFEVLVHLGAAERRVAPEIETLHGAPVAGNHRLQHRAPAIGAVHVA